jgi:lipopolysaccharide export LptBFGC system permease protein LptF
VLRGSAGWPVDKRRDWTRLLWSALAAFFVSMTCLVAVPLAQQRWFYTMAPGAGKALSMTTLLLPQAVPIALPLCVLIGATFGLTGGDRTRVPQGATLLLGVVLSAASFATAVWVLPEANQAFRVLVMGPHVRPGLPELSQAALRQFLDEPADVTMRILSASSAAAAWVYYVRYALSIAPLVLAMFALSLLATRRAGRIARIVAAFVAVAVYYGCLWTARPLVLDGTVPAFAAVWFPNVALGIVSLVLFAVPPPGNATCRDARISS